MMPNGRRVPRNGAPTPPRGPRPPGARSYAAPRGQRRCAKVQAPVDVSVPAPGGGVPQLAVDALGDAIVVWAEPDDLGYTVKAAVRPDRSIACPVRPFALPR